MNRTELIEYINQRHGEIRPTGEYLNSLPERIRIRADFYFHQYRPTGNLRDDITMSIRRAMMDHYSNEQNRS